MVYHNRKIRNKERVGNRGPKLRYAVFRAELNRRWEFIFEALVRRVCEDNKLAVEDHLVVDKRVPWEHTWDSLKAKGYRLRSRSIRDIQLEAELAYDVRYKIGRFERGPLYTSIVNSGDSYESTKRTSLAET